MKLKFFYKFYFYLVLLFLYIPIFVVISFAFNESKSRSVFSGFSLKWFINLFQNKTIISAFYNSLILATTASTIATILGTIFAFKILKMSKKQQTIFLNLNYLPIINADITMGVSLMMVLQLILNIVKQQMGFVTVLIAHIVICLPYVIFTIIPRIKQLNQNQLNAALDLGCTPLAAIFKVILPQISAEILAAFMIAFSISFDDFTVAYFTAGSCFQTLPILIYSMVRKRITPAINALFALIFAFAFSILVIINIINLKSKHNQ